MGTIHVYVQDAGNASQSSEPLGKGRHNVHLYMYSTLENTNKKHRATPPRQIYTILCCLVVTSLDCSVMERVE